MINQTEIRAGGVAVSGVLTIEERLPKGVTWVSVKAAVKAERAWDL